MKNYLTELLTMTPSQRKAFAETMSILTPETLKAMERMSTKIVDDAIAELKGEDSGEGGLEWLKDAGGGVTVDLTNPDEQRYLSKDSAIRLRDQLNKAFPVEK